MNPRFEIRTRMHQMTRSQGSPTFANRIGLMSDALSCQTSIIVPGRNDARGAPTYAADLPAMEIVLGLLHAHVRGERLV
jgi:hypothetical protein